MRNVLTSDGVFLVVQGKNNLSHLVEVLDWGVHGENTVPDEEHKVQEGPELDCPAVAGALRVFTGLEAEVESNGDQVSNMVGSGVGGGSCLPKACIPPPANGHEGPARDLGKMHCHGPARAERVCSILAIR